MKKNGTVYYKRGRHLGLKLTIHENNHESRSERVYDDTSLRYLGWLKSLTVGKRYSRLSWNVEFGLLFLLSREVHKNTRDTFKRDGRFYSVLICVDLISV